MFNQLIVTTITILDLGILAIPLVFLIILVFSRLKDVEILMAVLNGMYRLLHGFLCSLVIFLLGIYFDVSDIVLWISSAIGVILGLEIYVIHITWLANKGIKWAIVFKKQML